MCVCVRVCMYVCMCGSVRACVYMRAFEKLKINNAGPEAPHATPYDIWADSDPPCTHTQWKRKFGFVYSRRLTNFAVNKKTPGEFVLT